MVGRINKERKDEDNDSQLRDFIQILATQLQQLMNPPKPDDNDQDGAVKGCPSAPQKSRPESFRMRKGLPRPFDPRPRARRCLFPENPIVQSPLPPIPPCLPRKSSAVAKSHLGMRRHMLSRRRLVFDGDMSQSVEHSERFICDAADNDSPILTTPETPNKKPQATFDSEEENNPCDTPANNLFDDSDENQYTKSEILPVDVDDPSRWAVSTTPASAPLPSVWESPKSSKRTRRRRSDGDKDIKRRLVLEF